MTKKFTNLQLFSITDGRLSTDIGDVYDILNHICDDNLMTHHLPVALKYIKEKKPKWLEDQRADNISLGLKKEMNFPDCLLILNNNIKEVAVPQLKDEFDTSDFGDYMVENSLLLR